MRAIILCIIIIKAAYGQANTVLPFAIEGRVPGQANGKFAYLYVFPTGIQPSLFVSAPVSNGGFRLDGSYRQTDGGYNLARLFISDKPDLDKEDYPSLLGADRYHYRDLVLNEVVSVEIREPVMRSRVKGGPLNDDHNRLHEIRWKNALGSDSLRAWYRRSLQKAGKDLQSQKKIRSEYNVLLMELENRRVDEILQFVRQNPASPFAGDQLAAAASANQKLRRFQLTLEESLSGMPSEWLLSSKGRLTSQKIKSGSISRRLDEGVKLPDYMFSDDNDSMAVSNFKGKYFLMQFWTSWCSMCREQNKYINNAFDKFSSKGFAVLQISLDASQRNWERALREDRIPWKQGRCKRGWDRIVERTFEISGVPTNYLVDPKGIIVARNIQGKELEEKLTEIFK